jgi:hypothetical protein
VERVDSKPTRPLVYLFVAVRAREYRTGAAEHHKPVLCCTQRGWNQLAIAGAYGQEWQRLWQESDDYEKRY